MKTDILIIGAGPAGIFTAMELIRKGCRRKIVLAEKGEAVERRRCPKSQTGKCMNCRPNCHITTGFSGAGAFSDGKLSLSCEVGGDLPTLIGEQLAQEARQLGHAGIQTGFPGVFAHGFLDEVVFRHGLRRGGVRGKEVAYVGVDIRGDKAGLVLLVGVYDLREKVDGDCRRCEKAEDDGQEGENEDLGARRRSQLVHCYEPQLSSEVSLHF